MLTYFFFNLHISLHRKYTSSKNIYLFARDLKQVENHAFGEFYCPGSQRVQINFIFPESVFSNVKAQTKSVKLSKNSRNKRRSKVYTVFFVKSALILLPFIIVNQVSEQLCLAQ